MSVLGGKGLGVGSLGNNGGSGVGVDADIGRSANRDRDREGDECGGSNPADSLNLQVRVPLLWRLCQDSLKSPALVRR
jgi:hypothetical protein